MMHARLIFILSLLFIDCARPAEQHLKLIGRVYLPGVAGRMDHFAFDSKNNILYVAALGNNSVEVVDLESKKCIRSLKGFHEPQGLVFLPQSNCLLVANGGNGECDIIDAATFQKRKVISLGEDADNVRYDSAAGNIYVGYGEGAIAVVNANRYDITDRVKLSAHPESFQINTNAGRVYVNVPGSRQVEVIDIGQSRVVEQWKLTEANSNFPMALDNAHKRLFIGCRQPSRLLVLDTETGKTISSVSISDDVDDVYYDARKRLLYVSCGGGYVEVVFQNDNNTYTLNGKVKSRKGARTSVFIPGLNELVVAAPASLNQEAEILIYGVE